MNRYRITRLLLLLCALAAPLPSAAQYSSEAWQLKRTSDLYDERGYLQGKSLSIDGKLVVSNQGGGVSYSYPISSFQSKGFPVNVELNYANSVSFTAFHSYKEAERLMTDDYVEDGWNLEGAYRGWAKLHQNRPAWIIGVNGFAMQVLSTTPQFHCDPNKFLNNSKLTYDDEDVLWAVDGYDFCNRMYNISAIDPMSTEDGDAVEDVIRILRADGSLLELRKTTPLDDPDTTKVTGYYYVQEANQTGYARVEYDSTYFSWRIRDYLGPGTMTRPRRVRYYPGDGLEYEFFEWMHPFGWYAFSNDDGALDWTWGGAEAGPTIFYLERINGPGGTVLELERSRHRSQLEGAYGKDYTRGRALFTGFEGHTFTYGGNWVMIEALGRTTTVRFDSVVVDGQARNDITMPIAMYGASSPATWEISEMGDNAVEYKSYLGLVTKITDPEGRATRFGYEPYTRTYRNYAFPPNVTASGNLDVTLRNFRLNRVTEPTARYTIAYRMAEENPFRGVSVPSPDTTDDTWTINATASSGDMIPLNPYALNNVVKYVEKRDRLSTPLTTQYFHFDYDEDSYTGGIEVEKSTRFLTDHPAGLMDTSIEYYSRMGLDNGIPWHTPVIHTRLDSIEHYAAGVLDRTLFDYTAQLQSGQLVTPWRERRHIVQNGIYTEKSRTETHRFTSTVNTFGGDTTVAAKWGQAYSLQSHDVYDPRGIGGDVFRREFSTLLNLPYTETTLHIPRRRIDTAATLANYWSYATLGGRTLELEEALSDTSLGILVYETTGTDTILRRVPPRLGLLVRHSIMEDPRIGNRLLAGIGHRYYTATNDPARIGEYGRAIEDTIIGEGETPKIIAKKYTYGCTGCGDENLVTAVENANGARARSWYTFSVPVFRNLTTSLYSPYARSIDDRNVTRDTTLFGSTQHAVWYVQPVVERLMVRKQGKTGLDTLSITTAHERTFFGQARATVDPNGWLTRLRHDRNGRLEYLWLPLDHPHSDTIETVSYQAEHSLPLPTRTSFKRRVDTVKCSLQGSEYVPGSPIVGGMADTIFYTELSSSRPITVTPTTCHQCLGGKAKNDDVGSLLSVCNPPYTFDEIEYDAGTGWEDLQRHGYVAQVIFHADSLYRSAVQLDSLYLKVYVSSLPTGPAAVRVFRFDGLDTAGYCDRTLLFGGHAPLDEGPPDITNPLSGSDEEGYYIKIDLADAWPSTTVGTATRWEFRMATQGSEIVFHDGQDGADRRPCLVMKGTFKYSQTADYTLAFEHNDDSLTTSMWAKVDDSLHTASGYDHSATPPYTRRAYSRAYHGADYRVLRSEQTIGLAGGGTRVDSVVSAFTGGGAKVRVKDQEGDTIVSRYDALGRPVEMINQDGTTSTIEYIIGEPGDCGITDTDQEWWGYCSAAIATNENGVRHGQYHDPFGRLRREVSDIDGLALTTMYEYDTLDRVTQVTNPAGHVTSYTYDPFGRVKTKSQPDLGTISYAYDKVGNVRFVQTQEQADNDRVGFTHYDDLNRPMLVGEATIEDPPSTGRLTDTLDGAWLHDGVSTILTAGTPMWQNPSSAVPAVWAHSALAVSSCTLSPDTLLGESLSDPAITVSLRHPVAYHTPPNGPQARQHDFEQIAQYSHFVRIGIAYDEIPRDEGPVWKEFPSEAKWNRLAPKGSVRNVRGREVAVAYREHGGEPYHYAVMSYDERGRVEALLRWTENLGFDAVYYAYNSMNQVTSVTAADPLRSHTTWYGYDRSGRVDSVWTLLRTVGNGIGTGVGSDSLRVPTISRRHPAGSPDIVYDYTKTGQVKTMAYPPVNVLVEYAYNHRKWLDSMVATQGSSPLFRQVLTYGPTGQIFTQVSQHGTSPEQNNLYYHDDVGRLDYWYGGAREEDYSYDAVGNRTVHMAIDNATPATTTTTHRYNPADGPNRLDSTIAVTGTDTVRTDYGYDANGAVTGMTRTFPGAPTPEVDHYDYSWRGLNVGYHNERNGNPFQDWRYRYNAMGEREQKRVYQADNSGHSATDAAGWVYYGLGGNREQFAVYHGQELPTGCDTTTGPFVYMYPVEYLTYGLGGTMSVTTLPRHGGPNGLKEFKIADHLGSTRVTLREGSFTPAMTDYAPFGETIAGATARKGYIDKERDGESATNNHGARQYDPVAVGRFLSIDPLWERYPSLSPYNYACNNPLILSDPSGLAFDFVDFTIVDQAGTNQRALLNDLHNKTGLTFSINEESKFLTYATNADGTPIIAAGVGSERARELMIAAIKNEHVVPVSLIPNDSEIRGSQWLDGKIYMDPLEIGDMMSGAANGLNATTMGWAITFMHEAQHSPAAGGKLDMSGWGNIGDVETVMNDIRRQLGADYGQRRSYSALDVNGKVYVPFDQVAFDKLSLTPPQMLGMYIGYVDRKKKK